MKLRNLKSSIPVLKGINVTLTAIALAILLSACGNGSQQSLEGIDNSDSQLSIEAIAGKWYLPCGSPGHCTNVYLYSDNAAIIYDQVQHRPLISGTWKNTVGDVIEIHWKWQNQLFPELKRIDKFRYSSLRLRYFDDTPIPLARTKYSLLEGNLMKISDRHKWWFKDRQGVCLLRGSSIIAGVVHTPTEANRSEYLISDQSGRHQSEAFSLHIGELFVVIGGPDVKFSIVDEVWKPERGASVHVKASGRVIWNNEGYVVRGQDALDLLSAISRRKGVLTKESDWPPRQAAGRDEPDNSSFSKIELKYLDPIPDGFLACLKAKLEV